MWKSKRQMLSFVLAGTLITSSLLPPVSAAAAEGSDSMINTEEQAANSSETQLPLTDGGEVKTDNYVSPVAEEGKVVAFDFNEVNSTIVKDTSGSGRDGVLRNYDKGGTSIVDANIYGRDVRALSLPGGMEGGYLELQTGLLNGLESATISCWVNLSTDTGYQRIWDFGTGTESYAYLLSDGANTGAEGYAAAITTSGWSKEQVANKPEGIEKNKWVLTTAVFDGPNHTLSLYENGKKVAEKTDLTIGVADLSNTDKNYIGWGQFDNNEKTKGLFADFAIYNYPMNEEQVASLYEVSDEDIVSSDLAAIDLGDLTQISSDLTLPAAGANGTAFRWESTDSNVIDPATGKVTRPAAGSQDAHVTLTVYGTYGTVADSIRKFEVTVLAMPNSDTIVKHDLEALDLGDLTAVTANLTLPTQGEWGSLISWETDNADVVTKEGVITRPEAGAQAAAATLTATAKVEETSDTRTFTVTVLPKFELAQIESYDPITVKTRVGAAPALPAFVTVHYTDGTARELKTIWPASIEAEKYAKEGSFTVSGKIVDENMPIEATVNVIDEVQPGAEVLADMIDLSKISLDGDSILTQNKQRTVDYLLLLDNDRMLYNFRATFGQDTKGAEPLGGWDEPKGLLRGHSTGHYLSALALAYASTGDEELKVKSDEMIHELRSLQEMAEGSPEDFTTACNPKNAAQSLWSTDPKTWGEGFISAYSPDQFALLEQYTPYNTIWAPYYTLHKIIAGFLDTYQYTGNQEALDAAKELGIWVYRRLNACTAEQREKMWSMYIAGEYGGFNESMAKLYNITKDERYLEGAKFFDNKVFFDNLSINVDDIQGRHANQHIPQIVGAMEEYKATDDSYYYNIGKNFWDMVTSRYAYSIGGVGRGENFKKPYNQANDIETDRNCETCAAYNMLKLTKQLYQYEPDNAEYMDYYERTLYNQIIASQNQEVTEHMHNGTTYMLPIGPGVRKDYGGDYDSFTCCHGTGMENHVKYQEAAYFKSDDTLYVNLYIPSTVSWEEKGVSVKQENQFPSEKTKLTVSGNGEFKMKLRVPYWATKGFTVTVNGEEVQTDAALSSYMELNRTWKDGDIVEIQMPYDYHLDKTPDKLEGSTVASVMYGPFVMVAKESKQTWMSLMLAPELSQSIKKEEADLLTLKINGMTFVPMYTAYNFAYHTYFKIITTEEGGDAQNWYEVAIDNQRPKFGSVTADKVNVPEGGTVTLTFTPNEGYKVKKLFINGEPAEVAEDNTYTITDVRENISVEVLFGFSDLIAYDQDKLEAFAFAETSFCSDWETLDAVNDGIVSETSYGSGVNHYGTWGNDKATEEWVSYIWEHPVKINSTDMFFFDNSIGGDGGVQVPTSYKYEYLTADGNWQEVPNALGYGLEMDKFNTTSFDTVETTSLRVTMQKKAPGVGIIEWKVKGPKNDPQTKEYTVTFLDKDGNVIEAQKVKEGEAAKAPNAPKVEGYEFIGWDGDFTNVTKDLTIRAKYQQIEEKPQPQAKEYTVTFLDKDGKVISTQKVKEGKSATAPNAPKVEGYEFAGWSKGFTNVKGNITVQATYKKIAEQPTDNGKWIQNSTGWWYDNGDGTWSANSWKMVNGTWYYFDENGYMKTDWLEINGTWYHLNSNGAMATGWLSEGDTWYYLSDSGAMATGWADVNGTWYYLGDNGVMQNGWQNVNGEWYFMQENGAMVTDWLKDGDTWYYLNSNGSMATGWVEADGSWYYMQANGVMATGWQNIGGAWYYLNSNGAMVTDWLNDGGTWYYMQANGSMAIGWIEVYGAWYYMRGNGAMASSTWIGNYYVNASGAWTRTR